MIQLLSSLALALVALLVSRLFTAREQFVRELKESEERFRAFMDHSPAVAFMKDEEGRIVYVNEPLERLFQVRLDEIRGKTDFDWLPPLVADRLHQNDQTVLALDEPSELIEVIPTPDGRAHSFLSMKFPFRDGNGRRLVGGVAVDVTERESLRAQLAQQLQIANNLNTELTKANARLIDLATTDVLTGLLNYHHFRGLLAAQSSYSRRHSQSLSVVILDVDRFKEFNESYGHEEGDEVLIALAKTLRTAARDYDAVARYNGEEFAVLLPATDPETSTLAAERFRAAIEHHAWLLRPITVSVGVATTTAEPQTVQELLDDAQQALRASKRQGGNRVTHQSALASEKTELHAVTS